VWRIAFDRPLRAVGEMWAGHVGRNRYHPRLGNYAGICASDHSFNDQIIRSKRVGPPRPDLIAANLEYKPPALAISITGGNVYRGKPSTGIAPAPIYLVTMSPGKSGLLWYDRDKHQVTPIARSAERDAADSFGEDDNGEVYFLTPARRAS